jgi:hypothetical protein
MNKYLLTFLIVLLISCQKGNDFKFVDRETVIEFDTITKTEVNRGLLTMKSFRFRKYNFYSWCELTYKDSFPKWIDDRHGPDYSFNKYKFVPQISDIYAPYVIFKRKGENFFHIIKNSDTLKFKIESDREN